MARATWPLTSYKYFSNLNVNAKVNGVQHVTLFFDNIENRPNEFPKTKRKEFSKEFPKCFPKELPKQFPKEFPETIS